LWEPPLELWMSFSKLAVSPFVAESKNSDDTRNVVHSAAASFRCLERGLVKSI
jgi:hypothetical protein